MKRAYECMYIIDSGISEEKRNALVEKWMKMAGAGAKVEKMGLRKFASEINHKKEGFYYLMNFNATPDIPKSIGDLMNITNGMVRFLFVNKQDQKTIKQSKKAVKKQEEETPANE